MKIPMFNMTAGQQAKSKAMIAGWFAVGFGVYVFVETKDINQAWLPIAFGFGVMGIRDAK